MKSLTYTKNISPLKNKKNNKETKDLRKKRKINLSNLKIIWKRAIREPQVAQQLILNEVSRNCRGPLNTSHLNMRILKCPSVIFHI